ncbi:7tm 6 domain containing protein [Asbolus verrucosus]|uniref:Odorant receptor n=1 Tax=Asbolus verrucosus TaxID=1661398 RepID=A0A482VY66_ASBVE|nr:7tm 6 domain containing protein [Asbolus verrucosus]
MKSTVENFSWQQTLKVNILMLKMLGLWPPGDGTYGFNLYTLYKIFSALCFELCHIGAQTVKLFFILDDLQAVTGSIFVLLMEMLGLLKSYCIIRNMGMLKQLTITLSNDLFQPKNLHQKNLIQPSLNAWKSIASALWILCFGWMLTWMLSPIFDKSFKQYRLPFLAWYPYNTQTSPQYELTYLHQLTGISYICMNSLTSDTLIAALNMYIGAQFDILSDDVRNFYDGVKSSPADASGKLKSCIKHHKEILKLAEHANHFYKIFLYCWFGNEIEIKSSKLPYAVFESDWTELPPEVKTLLIIFILRTQRPLKMSAYGLFFLTLETFVKILRTAYSYFALLREVNSPQ